LYSCTEHQTGHVEPNQSMHCYIVMSITKGEQHFM